MSKDFNFSSPSKFSIRNQSLPSCPIQNVIRANEFGMIIESDRSFEVGEVMSIGFHLPSGRRDGQFIVAEALVVESEKLRLVQDRDAFRVTVLFSEISHEDRSRLIEVTRSSKASQSPVIGMN